MFQSWFKPNFIYNLQKVILCGTHGDPATAKDLYKICEYILENNSSVSIHIHTNGGLRKSSFWNSLGKLFKNTNCVVVFSIDGLEDTNHVYRRNVSWKKVIENVKAYNCTGAESNWEFLVFGHNEHQISDAQELSRELGFNKFLVKRALGFEDNEGLMSKKPVFDKHGNFQRYIFPPKSDFYLNAKINQKSDCDSIPEKIDLSSLHGFKKNYNPSVEKNLEKFDISDVPEWLQKIENSDLHCKSCIGPGSDSEIYVACDGIVYPCCYVGTEAYSENIEYDSLQLKKLLRNYGISHFNLNFNSLDNILYQQKHLDNLFAKSWNKDAFSNGKLSFCSSTCTKDNLINKIYTGNNEI
jgi:sulfatase maturation enzyme AslB (radical SAM superfamily)